MQLIQRIFAIALSTSLLVGALTLSGCASLNETSASIPSVSPQTKNTLAPTGVLRVGVYLGSPTSLVRVGPSGESLGIALELGKALGRQLGVPVQVVEFSRVAEVIAAIKDERVDMTFTNATAARAKEIDFTAPLVQLELGILVPTNTSIKNFSDVDKQGVRLGVSQGSSSQSVLGQRLKQTTIVPVPSLEVAASKLQNKELDAFATNKGILFELNEKLSGFQVLQDRWGLENLAIAIPKGRQDGLPFLNVFAQKVRENGQLDLMIKRAGLRGMTKQLITEQESP
jgi:polar amino acid transport system substrate-binding protein